MLNRLLKFGFTKQDLIIISFLLITFIAGLIIRFTGWKTPPEYDYTSSDKNFEKQSKLLFDNLDNKPLTKEQEERLQSLKKYADSLYAEKESQPKTKQELPSGTKININLAYATDLQSLPGIGEVMAERIIEYREQKKGFKKIEDIMNVKGIGDKKYEKIKDYITVE
jgi:comEA protein